MGHAAMLEKKYALPGAELQLPISYRNDLAGPRQCHANVRGAVVAPFLLVLVLGIFGHEPFEESLQVAPRGRRGVLHHNQAATRVLDEHRGGAACDTTLFDRSLHLLRNLVGAFAVSLQFEAAGLCAHPLRRYRWINGLAIVALATACIRAATEADIAPLYKRAVAGDKRATEQCVTLLEDVVKEQPNNQVARVYLGSAYALRSRAMSFGFAKLSTFRRAMALMDDAVAAAPENPRVRLVRALTCDPLPAFLGRRQVAHEDFTKLAEMAKRFPENFTPGELKIVHEHAR